MSLYIYKIEPVRVEFRDSPTAEEDGAMSKHFDYLKNLLRDGKLFLAGPCTDAAFGIVIFEAGSPEEAHTIAFSDPTVLAGVMTAEVHPFRLSLLRQS